MQHIDRSEIDARMELIRSALKGNEPDFTNTSKTQAWRIKSLIKSLKKCDVSHHLSGEYKVISGAISRLLTSNSQLKIDLYPQLRGPQSDTSISARIDLFIDCTRFLKPTFNGHIPLQPHIGTAPQLLFHCVAWKNFLALSNACSLEKIGAYLSPEDNELFDRFRNRMDPDGRISAAGLAAFPQVGYENTLKILFSAVVDSALSAHDASALLEFTDDPQHMDKIISSCLSRI